MPAKAHKTFWTGLLIALTFALIYALFAHRVMVPDVFFTIVLVLGLRWFTCKHLSVAAQVSVVLAIAIHLLGTFGLYPTFLIGTIGYDKLVHFVSGIAIMVVFLSALHESMPRRYLIAFLLVLGAGATVEISEFIGTRYFGIDNGGVFAIGDGLPIVSDWQTYDIYFDLIISVLGGALAALVDYVYRLNLKKKRTH